MSTLLAIIMTIGCLIILLCVRNEVVFRIRMKAIRIIFSFDDWQKTKQCLENPNYWVMVSDLTKWNFKQFYPQLIEKAERLENA